MFLGTKGTSIALELAFPPTKKYINEDDTHSQKVQLQNYHSSSSHAFFLGGG